jgi:hypothetical protein
VGNGQLANIPVGVLLALAAPARVASTMRARAAVASVCVSQTSTRQPFLVLLLMCLFLAPAPVILDIGVLAASGARGQAAATPATTTTATSRTVSFFSFFSFFVS